MMCQNNSVPFEQVIQSLMQLLEGQGYCVAVLARNRRISDEMRGFLRENKSDFYTEDTGRLSFAKRTMCHQKQKIMLLYSPNA